MQRLAYLIGTCFGIGKSPIMPGTCASIVAIAPLLLVPDDVYLPVTGALAVLGLMTGAWTARAVMAVTRSEDPSECVSDELAGVWIAAIRPENPGLTGILLALVCFRVFDILKPWPIRKLERLPRGFGVLLDDVAAGLLALVASWGLEVGLF